MKITKTLISFSTEEAFDHLYHKDQRVWREAVDLIAEFAEECFQRHYQNVPNLESPVENGINFCEGEEGIYFES